MALTANQIRLLNEQRDYLPSLKKGELSAADQIKLGDILTRPVAMEARTGVIGIGADDVLIQFSAALDGSPAAVALLTVDATATTLLSAVWNGTGGLTITANANATAATTVSAIVVPVTT